MPETHPEGLITARPSKERHLLRTAMEDDATDCDRWIMALVHGYVGVTDGEWYRYLAARPELAEVNFWQPSGGRQFRAIAPGELFLFKTHYPHNRVVGEASLAARFR